MVTVKNKTSTKSILDSFPSHLKPRDVQKHTLLALEQNIDKANVIVINIPVASGKSALSLTIARYFKQASIITPTKLLVDQYKNEYPNLHVLRSKHDYFCDIYQCPLDERPSTKKAGKLCKKAVGCSGCSVYLEDLRKAHVMPYLLSNYYIYLAHKLYRKILIIDEAHNLIDMLKKMASTKLWRHKYLYPEWVKTREDIKAWVNNLDPRYDSEDLAFLRNEINSLRPSYLIKSGEQLYHGEQKPCIEMLPLDIRNAPPIMWPNKVEKIILLSATISRKDIEQLGFADKKIIYIEADSPIVAERRPVIIPQETKNMSFKYQTENIPLLAEYIKKLAGINNKDKGLIHITYSLAVKLRPFLINDPRFIFHDKFNKSEKYNLFRNSPDPLILVASGMYEGIDLKFDAGRWQLISKVPWPSLADPAISYLASQDEDWYLWECIKTVMQATGRICRDPEDYGETYIFDSTVNRLFEQGIAKGFIPKWFENSLFIN